MWRGPSRLSVSGGHLACLHEVVDGKDVWFFANSSDTPVDTTVPLRGEHQLERWDPHTGRIEECAANARGGSHSCATAIESRFVPVLRGWITAMSSCDGFASSR